MRMNWKGCRILVTGAGGFIGSHLVEELLVRGARVRAFVRYNSRGATGFLSLLPKKSQGELEVIAGDLKDASAVKKAMEGCQIVFHLGAAISIPYSYAAPCDVVQTNVMGTLNVLEAARQIGVRRLVHTSTSEVYGTAMSVPISESHPLQGQSPYSASKIAADKIAESYYRAFAVPVVTVRPFNTFGPRQSARAVIPTIITQALGSTEIRLGILSSTRDFTFVRDTARGFLCAAEAEGVEGREVNLGNNQEISVEALAGKILRLLGKSMSIVQEDVRLRPGKSEVQRLHADNSLARRLLGWEPQVSLEDGLRETIEWVRRNLDQYDVGRYQI